MIGWWAPWVITMDGPPLRDALILVDEEAGTISSITADVRRSDAVRVASDANVKTWHESIIAPGFVNLHSHIEYGGWDLALTDLYAGRQMPFGSFSGWISDHILRKRRLSEEDLEISANYGARQLLSSGITFTVDASYTGSAALAAMGNAGIRGIVCGETFGSDPRGASEVLMRLTEHARDWPLIDAGLSPHAPYSAAKALFEFADDSRKVWTSHLLESRDEMLHYRGQTNLAEGFAGAGIELPPWAGSSPSPVDELWHTFSPRSILVHLVHSDDHDIRLIRESGAVVVHCPRSNTTLRCGELPLEKFTTAGVSVCLGTDSPASAGPMDMFDEMRSALETHDSLLDPLSVLEMATTIPADAIGRPDLGRLVVGGAADMFVYAADEKSRDGLFDDSLFDPAETLVRQGSRSRVQSTMISGNLVYMQAAETEVGQEMMQLDVEISNLVDRLAEPVAHVATK